MRRAGTVATEVRGCIDEPGAEVVLPEPVDNDASGERACAVIEESCADDTQIIFGATFDAVAAVVAAGAPAGGRGRGGGGRRTADDDGTGTWKKAARNKVKDRQRAKINQVIKDSR